MSDITVENMVNEIRQILNSNYFDQEKQRKEILEVWSEANNSTNDMALKMKLVDACEKELSKSGVSYRFADKKSLINSVIYNFRQVTKLEEDNLLMIENKVTEDKNDGIDKLCMYIGLDYKSLDAVKIFDNNKKLIGEFPVEKSLIESMKFLAGMKTFCLYPYRFWVDKGNNFYDKNCNPVTPKIGDYEIKAAVTVGSKLFLIAKDGTLFDEDGNEVKVNLESDKKMSLINGMLDKMHEVLISSLSYEEKKHRIEDILMKTTNTINDDMSLIFECIEACRKICKDNNMYPDEYLNNLKESFISEYIANFKGKSEFENGLLMLERELPEYESDGSGKVKENGKIQKSRLYIDPEFVPAGKNNLGEKLLEIKVFDNNKQFVGNFVIEEEHLDKFKNKNINLEEGFIMPKNNNNNLVNDTKGQKGDVAYPYLDSMSKLLDKRDKLLDKLLKREIMLDEVFDALKDDVVEKFALTKSNQLLYLDGGIELLENSESIFYKGLPREVHDKLDACVFEAECTEKISNIGGKFSKLRESENISVTELENLETELTIFQSDLVDCGKDGRLYSKQKLAVAEKYSSKAEELGKAIKKEREKFEEMSASKEKAVVKPEGAVVPDLVVDTGNRNVDLLKPKQEVKGGFATFVLTLFLTLLSKILIFLGINKPNPTPALAPVEDKTHEVEEFEIEGLDDEDKNKKSYPLLKSGEGASTIEKFEDESNEVQKVSQKELPVGKSDDDVNLDSKYASHTDKVGLFNLSRLNVVAQDITKSGAEVIVNSGCTGSGCGVDKAVFENFNIQKNFALDANRAMLVKATSKNSSDISAKTSWVVLTEPNGDVKRLEGLYFNVFDEIIKSGAESAAIPLIGNGTFKIFLEDTAECLVNALMKYPKELNNIDNIILCLYGDIRTRDGKWLKPEEAVEIVKKMIDKRFGRDSVINEVKSIDEDKKSKVEEIKIQENKVKVQKPATESKKEEVVSNIKNKNSEDKKPADNYNNLSDLNNNEEKAPNSSNVDFNNIDSNKSVNIQNQNDLVVDTDTGNINIDLLKPESNDGNSINDAQVAEEQVKLKDLGLGSENQINNEQENYDKVKVVGDSLYEVKIVGDSLQKEDVQNENIGNNQNSDTNHQVGNENNNNDGINNGNGNNGDNENNDSVQENIAVDQNINNLNTVINDINDINDLLKTFSLFDILANEGNNLVQENQAVDNSDVNDNNNDENLDVNEDNNNNENKEQIDNNNNEISEQNNNENDNVQENQDQDSEIPDDSLISNDYEEEIVNDEKYDELFNQIQNYNDNNNVINEQNDNENDNVQENQNQNNDQNNPVDTESLIKLLSTGKASIDYYGRVKYNGKFYELRDEDLDKISSNNMPNQNQNKNQDPEISAQEAQAIQNSLNDGNGIEENEEIKKALGKLKEILNKEPEAADKKSQKANEKAKKEAIIGFAKKVNPDLFTGNRSLAVFLRESESIFNELSKSDEKFARETIVAEFGNKKVEVKFNTSDVAPGEEETVILALRSHLKELKNYFDAERADKNLTESEKDILDGSIRRIQLKIGGMIGILNERKKAKSTEPKVGNPFGVKLQKVGSKDNKVGSKGNDVPKPKQDDKNKGSKTFLL